MTNSITNEGIDKMGLMFGKSRSYAYINMNSLDRLFIQKSKEGRSLSWGLAAIYEMGRIDGIRQERDKRNSVKSKIIQEPIENNSIELAKITIGTRTFVEVRKEQQAI